MVWMACVNVRVSASPRGCTLTACGTPPTCAASGLIWTCAARWVMYAACGCFVRVPVPRLEAVCTRYGDPKSPIRRSADSWIWVFTMQTQPLVAANQPVKLTWNANTKRAAFGSECTGTGRAGDPHSATSRRSPFALWTGVWLFSECSTKEKTQSPESHHEIPR